MFTHGFKSSLFTHGLVRKHCIQLRVLQFMEGSWACLRVWKEPSCRDIWEMTLDWYWYYTSPSHVRLWDIITCRDLKELRSNHAPRDILTGESASSNGGGPDSSCPWTNKSQGVPVAVSSTWGLIFLNGQLPQALKLALHLGAGRLVGSSSLGSDFFSSDKALLCRDWMESQDLSLPHTIW